MPAASSLVVGAAPGPADDPRELPEEIERTREHLGETVKALVAKVDVKARTQDEAGRLIGRLKAKAVQARRRAAQARRQAAGNAATTARRCRTPLLAAAGTVGAGLVGWLLFQRWRRRG